MAEAPVSKVPWLRVL